MYVLTGRAGTLGTLGPLARLRADSSKTEQAAHGPGSAAGRHSQGESRGPGSQPQMPAAGEPAAGWGAWGIAAPTPLFRHTPWMDSSPAMDKTAHLVLPEKRAHEASGAQAGIWKQCAICGQALCGRWAWGGGSWHPGRWASLAWGWGGAGRPSSRAHAMDLLPL